MNALESPAPDIRLPLPDGMTLLIECWQESIVRVRRVPRGAPPAAVGLGVLPAARGKPVVRVEESAAQAVLRTDRLEVRVEKPSGRIAFLDRSGSTLLSEAGGDVEATQYDGHATYRSVQRWEQREGQTFHGLGNLNLSSPDLRGQKIVGVQANTTDAVPVLVSSGGYAVIWNNPARFDFDATDPHVWSLSSPMGEGVDYFLAGGPPAEIVRAYRLLTGDAPLFPRWAYGYLQCRERYTCQVEVLEVAERFREERFPIDGIIQDWRYWGQHGWNACRFDSLIFPDPGGMIRKLHELNLRLTISVWPAFDEGPKGSPVYRALNDAGHLIVAGDPRWQAWRRNCYNAFDPAARELLWQHVDRNLLRLGMDGWWLDATEPEFLSLDLAPRAFDLESRRNAYPLAATQTFYDGQRRGESGKRVFILTRSAWLGLQRNAAAYWTGDVNSDWKTFAQQVLAGINFAYTGIPYWNTDIGGFSHAHELKDKAAWDELYVRWFQFGAFCPLFRSHGTDLRREPWYFGGPGDQAYDTLRRFADLRYRLMPYIYSCAWGIMARQDSFMRPLAMEFPADPRAAACVDQYLFGPALMVCPVVREGAAAREVYLPAAEGWYDFWTGARAAGQTLTAPAPLDRMPLYVRAGAIIPMGPMLQHSGERPADPVELRVYRGADGAFELYEDEGDGYRYEEGARAVIPIRWDEAAGTLHIGRREGRFPGMLETRTFRVTFVKPGRGAGVEADDTPDAVVNYDGRDTQVPAPS